MGKLRDLGVPSRSVKALGRKIDMGEPRETIVDRFEKIARQFPSNLAVKIADRSVTYQELNNAANLVAQAILEKRGAGQEPIAILFGHGIGGVAALLGVAKAGKFYCALDSAAPLERNRYILGDTQAPLLLTDDGNLRLAQQLGQGDIPILSVDDVGSGNNGLDSRLHAGPDTLFAINYTSGSTGLPKAVMQTHSCRLHDTSLHAAMANIVSADRLSLLQPAGFVGAEVQLFRALYSGAALFPFDPRTEGVPALLQWLRREAVSVLHMTPPLFREVASLKTDGQMLPQLRLVNLSGAPISEQDASLFSEKFAPLARLVIHMGSTEAGAICSAAIDERFSFPKRGAPVGYSLPGKTIVVLDEDHNEVAPGAVGEIAVRSRYLAAGYWRDPGLTRDKFLPDPAGGDLRTYLTGDLGRQLSDGFLLHLGRKDFMVKVRGNRVELGEIESALLAQGKVKDAAVKAWEDKAGDHFLVAYLVARDPSAPSLNEVRGLLAAKLPDFMIPARFIYLPALPLKNGKVDLQALPKPESQRPDLTLPYIRPQSELETKLSEIWQEVLGIQPIGIADDFFALGGDSLKATRVISRVMKHFQCDVPLRLLFESPTIDAMALVILKHQALRLEEPQLRQILDELELLSDKEAKRQLS